MPPLCKFVARGDVEDDLTTMAALSVVATLAASLEPVRKQPREPSAE